MKKLLLALAIAVLLATPAWGYDYDYPAEFIDRICGRYDVTWTIGDKTFTDEFQFVKISFPPNGEAITKFQTNFWLPWGTDNLTWTTTDPTYNETWTHTVYVLQESINAVFITGYSDSKKDSFGVQTYFYEFMFPDYQHAIIKYGSFWQMDGVMSPWLYMEGTMTRK
jgi:hypothetical protein